MTDKNIDSNLIRGKVTLRRAENRETLLPLAFPLNHSPTIEHEGTNWRRRKRRRRRKTRKRIRERFALHSKSDRSWKFIHCAPLSPLIKGKIGSRQVSPRQGSLLPLSLSLYIYSNSFAFRSIYGIDISRIWILRDQTSSNICHENIYPHPFIKSAIPISTNIFHSL